VALKFQLTELGRVRKIGDRSASCVTNGRLHCKRGRQCPFAIVLPTTMVRSFVRSLKLASLSTTVLPSLLTKNLTIYVAQFDLELTLHI